MGDLVDHPATLERRSQRVPHKPRDLHVFRLAEDVKHLAAITRHQDAFHEVEFAEDAVPKVVFEAPAGQFLDLLLNPGRLAFLVRRHLVHCEVVFGELAAGHCERGGGFRFRAAVFGGLLEEFADQLHNSGGCGFWAHRCLSEKGEGKSPPWDFGRSVAMQGDVVKRQ